MKKSFLFLSILCNFGLIAYVMYTHVSYKKTAEKNQDPSNQKKHVHKIAILTPVAHPSLEQIEHGFIDTLNKSSLSCDFKTYNANGNRMLMRSAVEEVLHSNVDLIFTIGAHATQLAKEVTTKKQNLIPIVFGAVKNPVSLDLVASETSSGNHVTGVIEGTDYDLQLTLLQKLKPATQRILLVYNPTQGAGLEKDKETIEALVKQKNIQLTSVEIYNTNEIYNKVSSLLSQTDVVMILKDNTVVAGLDGLIKLCNQHNVTLLATDLDSVDKGAALGLGVHEYDFGVDAAAQAQLILEHKKTPTQIPLKPGGQQKLKINTQAMLKQNLALDAALLFLMQSSEVV